MKKAKQPIRACLSNRIYWYSSCDWLIDNFLCGTEIGWEQLKKPPCKTSCKQTLMSDTTCKSGSNELYLTVGVMCHKIWWPLSKESRLEIPKMAQNSRFKVRSQKSPPITSDLWKSSSIIICVENHHLKVKLYNHLRTGKLVIISAPNHPEPASHNGSFDSGQWSWEVSLSSPGSYSRPRG